MSRAHAEVRSHTVYLFSENADANDRPWDCRFEIPANAVYTARPDHENIKVSLLSFHITADWSEINAGNNALRVAHGGSHTDITVPPGNWSMERLAGQLSVGPVRVSYDVPSNRFAFRHVDGEPIALTFLNASHEVLGFLATDAPAGTTVVSTVPVVPRRNTELFVNLENATQGDGNLCYSNQTSAALQPTSILGIVPISAAPYRVDHVVSPVLGEMCGVYLAATQMSHIELSITDARGRPATWIGHWRAVLKVQVVEYADATAAETRDAINEMKASIERLLMLKVMK
jgi:hypothetical protein